MPSYLNALEGRGVHVVTVNDYLARRDMEWMAPLVHGPGLNGRRDSKQHAGQGTTGSLRRKISLTGPTTSLASTICATTCVRAARGTMSGFRNAYQQSQGPLAFAIIDEVDNILIDEARTPLIISGPAHKNPARYVEANKIATAAERRRSLSGQRKGPHRDPKRTKGCVTPRKTCRRREFLHRRQHGLAAHDRQRAQGTRSLQDRCQLRHQGRRELSSSMNSPDV